jgi:Stage II sporulation protein E (SpoIIE)./Tetratricopeptide repeat.
MADLTKHSIRLSWVICSLFYSVSLFATNLQDTGVVINIIKSVRQKNSTDKTFDNTDSIKIYQALTLAQELNFASGKSQCFDILGISERNKANYSKALEFHLKALNLLPESTYLRDKSIILNNIGVVYRRLDDLTHATEYHLSALKIAEQINDVPTICVSLNSLGNIFVVQEKYADAKRYFEMALEKEIALHNMLGIAINYENLGGVYKELKQYAKAADYYKKSLEVNQSIGSKKGIAICYSDLGTIAIQDKNYATAMDYFTQALEMNKARGDNRYIVDSYINIGDVYLKKGDFLKARDHYQKGIGIGLKIGSKQLVQKAYEGMSECYEKLGKYAAALDFYKKASALNDSIRSETISKYVNQMQIIYESGKKDQEIKLLNYQQTVKDKKQKAVVGLLIAGCFFLFILASLIYFNYRLKKRANTALVEYNRDMEEKNALLVNQKEEIMTQRDELELKRKQINDAYELIKVKNENITDNIRYAVQIQNVMLPELSYIRSLFPESFIFYQPKDIVSGDFYWVARKSGKVIIAVADCTGHGVTGAFMSILGITALNEIVMEKNIVQTDQILNLLREKIIWTLQQGTEFSESKEGIHLVVCAIDLLQKKLQFSGAINSFYLVRNQEIVQYKGDLMPISIYPDMMDFKSTDIYLQKDDMIYLFSDGYYGQFGGNEDKKFGLPRFKELLQEISDQPIEKQNLTVEQNFKEWKENAEQVDDILVMGIRI